MAIKITMTNKWLYSLIAVGVFLALSVGVLAPEVPSISFGHSAEDVFARVGGNWMTIQSAIDQGLFASNLSFDTASSGLSGLIIKDIAPSRGYHQNFMCVLLSTNEVKCAGYNGWGNLGIGDTYQRTKFELVVELDDVDKLVNIGRLNTCATLQGSGKLKCWGYNGYGQLGDGTTAYKKIPTFVINGADDTHLENVIEVKGKPMNYAYTSVCAITSEATGNLYCWGYNGYGQLGIAEGDTSSRTKAAQVPYFSEGWENLSVKNVSLGGYSTGGFTCAIVGDSRGVYCWGYNGYGQLGVGDVARRTTPQRVSGLTDVHSLELSHDDYGTSCAIVGASREVYCWGYNTYGQLGIGSNYWTGTHYKTTPQKVNGLTDVSKLKSIGTGSYSSYCALLSNETLYCWGYNGFGVLGVDDTTLKDIPIQVAITSVKDIEGYGYSQHGHYCAIVNASREVYCWGYNGYGQVGQESTGNSYYTVPQKVLGISGDVSKISCGGYHGGNMCSALLDSGDVRVWGYNGYGNLGAGDTLNKYVATAPS
jgi:alpha-tubulin suppressor-like RCC1 family protein